MPNIPLNINWQQILLHLFNFSILAGGLYLLLYKPVKDFMDKRTAYFESLKAEAESELTHATELKLEYEAKLQNASDEIRIEKEKAASDAGKLAAARVEAAKAHCDKLISEAIITAKRDRERIIAEASHEIAALAVAATEKLLSSTPSQMYDQFLSTSAKEHSDE